MKFDKILIPLDGSRFAEAALSKAMARQQQPRRDPDPAPHHRGNDLPRRRSDRRPGFGGA
jgi:hypothetical protein